MSKPLSVGDRRATTVADALALSVLKQGLPEVLAGRESLQREVRWVHAGEVPHMATLLSGGELLLTTGMGLGARSAEQRRYVDELAARGLAGLVIELGDALRSVPETAVVAAERHGLPLVALHRPVRFVEVTRAIHTALVNRQYDMLRRGEEIHLGLVNMMLDGDGIAEVLTAFAQVVDNPVVLEAADGRLLYRAGDTDAAALWDTSRGRGAVDAVCADVPMGPGPGRGKLVIVPYSRPVSDLDRIVLGHVAGIVALALLRARQEEELMVRERGNLLADLVEGTIDATQAAREATMLGFTASERLLPLAIVVSDGVGEPGWSAAQHDLTTQLQAHGLPFLGGGRAGEGRLLGLVAVPTTKTISSAVEVIAASVETIARRRPSPWTPTIAIGDRVGWAGAGEALALALDTAACARHLPSARWHSVRDLELQRLLWRLVGDETLDAFVERTLGPLLDYDRGRKLSLLPTLRALCNNGGHKTETARELRVHRGTLYSRLTRIGQILDVDLADRSRLLTLQVALEASRYSVRRQDLHRPDAGARDDALSRSG
ncbi:MAG TPA: PucR family transcriptional regulator [Baekduia sp.]|nr:PucR family transcriptional regulator [Baekduia sp.]